MGIWDWNLWRNMWGNICIVDHSESLWYGLCEMSSKGLVSDSRHSKAVKLVNFAENLFNIKSCQDSKSASKRETCNPNISISVESSQSLYIFPNVTFNSLKSIVESLMDKAVGASRIFDLSSIKISNPILNVNLSFKCNNNSVVFLRIASESVNI